MILRQWLSGYTAPITLREDDNGDIQFASDPESINADVVLHKEDIHKLIQWLSSRNSD